MVAADAPRKAMMRANSPSHEGEGQNVLYADGHVDWSPTIFCGAARPIAGAPRDNVYAYGADATASAPSAGIVGAPRDPYDSVILPTADMGPQPGPLPAPAAVKPSSQPVLVGVGAAALVALVVMAVAALLRPRRAGVAPAPADAAYGTGGRA